MLKSRPKSNHSYYSSIRIAFLIFILDTFRDTDDVKKRKRGDGVTFEDYHLLSQRIDKMEASIGGITNKVFYNINSSIMSKFD